MVSLEERVLSYIDSQGLLAPGEGVMVGVSGGPDSVCLLHMLSRLRHRLGVKPWAAYLDHGLRGMEGEADGLYVAQLCQSLEVPLRRHGVDVANYRHQHHLSWEAAARQLRYDFLASVALEAGAQKVAVGHTADDQVETVLLHLLRGSGLRGLRGMAPRSRWGEVVIIRPLLEVSRKETEAYCREWKLEPRQDSTNLSPVFLRNRLRRQVIPRLQGINPRLRQALLRACRGLAQDLDLVETELRRVRSEVARGEPAGVSLARGNLAQLHPSLQRHLLLGEGEGLGVSLEGVHVEAMLASLSRPGTTLNLPGGLAWVVEYDRAWLGRGLPSPPFPPLLGGHPVAIAGESHLPGWRVRTRVVSPIAPIATGPFTASLDADKVGEGLVVRGWRLGDRFQPLGMTEEKKLQDFWVDAKVPRSWRKVVPLLASAERILWVVGYRIDDRVKVTPETSSVLEVEFQRVQ